MDVVCATDTTLVEALIGFQVMGLVVASPNTLVTPLGAVVFGCCQVIKHVPI